MNETKAHVEAGTKVKYCLPDKKGKMHWFNGVVHAVRNYENENQVVTKTTYLVDTGRDIRVDVIITDERDVEMAKQLDKLSKKRPLEKIETLVKEIIKKDDLPESNPQTEQTRQPEQLELPASQIKVV